MGGHPFYRRTKVTIYGVGIINHRMRLYLRFWLAIEKSRRFGGFGDWYRRDTRHRSFGEQLFVRAALRTAKGEVTNWYEFVTSCHWPGLT